MPDSHVERLSPNATEVDYIYARAMDAERMYKAGVGTDVVARCGNVLLAQAELEEDMRKKFAHLSI